MTIFENPAPAVAGRYPAQTFRLRHRLAGHPLFTLPALLDLARRLPPETIEYNAGDVGVVLDPAQTPMTGLSVEESIRRIAECNSWMVLKNVQVDPDYRSAMEDCLAEIAPTVEKATGPMERKIGFIFISSAGAVTPLHIDPEHNILMQIAGTKSMTIYRDDGALIDDEFHERYHAGLAHRNLTVTPAFEGRGEAFDLAPGDAVHVPLKAPHYVRNGPEPSVSFSITWRSRASLDEASLRLANHWARARGMTPPRPGAAPMRDRLAILAHRAAMKVGAIKP